MADPQFNILQKPPPEDDKKGWYRFHYKVCEILNNLLNTLPAWVFTVLTWPFTFTAPTQGDLITYDDASGQWINSRKIGTLTSYTEFEADGTMVAVGDASKWDDVYPSSVTIGVGGTAPSFTAYNGGNLRAYEFTGGVSDKQIQIGYQLYHSYIEGSEIYPHAHITFTSGAASAGQTIIFDLEYEWSNGGATGAYGTTTLRGTYTIAANNTVYKNEIVHFTGSPITGTGKLISSIFMTRLVRMQSVDTFTGSCWLMSADIHIEKDMMGSRQVLIK